MILFRTTADRFLDLVINHPSVRPTIEQGQHRLSSLDLLSDYRNVCLAGEGGALLFVWQTPGVYQAHVMLIDTARGAAGIELGKAATAAMFDIYGAARLLASAPLDLPAVGWYARRLGFVSKGRDSEQEFFEMEVL